MAKLLRLRIGQGRPSHPTSLGSLHLSWPPQNSPVTGVSNLSAKGGPFFGEAIEPAPALRDLKPKCTGSPKAFGQSLFTSMCIIAEGVVYYRGRARIIRLSSSSLATLTLRSSK